MKKRFHSIKKIYIVTVLLTVIVLTSIGLSTASYLNQAYKRGVVSNSEEEAIRFTSNYLSLVQNGTNEEDFAQRIITFKESEPGSETESGILSCGIDVRNYISGSANLINEYTITYTLEVKLKNAKSNKAYSVNNVPVSIDNNGDGICVLEDQILSGRSQKENTHTIVFYNEDLNNLSITVTAIPENTAYTGGKILAAKILPCTKADTKQFSCVGKFADQDSSNPPSNFNAYNYEIILANGCAKVTLEWDAELYEIDQFFESKLEPKDIEATTEGKLVFIMDQTKGNDSYIIPFYKKNKGECNALSWDDMANKIFISAEELAPETTNN